MPRSVASTLLLLSLAIFAPALSGCTAATAEPDELAATDADLGDLGAADAASGLYTYYTLRQDFRRCIYPLCGGYWVARVNRSTTTCADGSRAAECYVSDVDLASLGLSDAEAAGVRGALGRAVVRGRLVSRTAGSYPAPALVATEAWTAPTDFVPVGVFVHLRDRGVRCFTYPCVSIHEEKLNSSLTADIAAIDFSPSGATDDEIGAAHAALADGGLIVAGYRTTVTGPGGRARARTATAFYVRATHSETGGCFVGGCSSHVCTDRADVITTCEFRPEYACYRTATCARQVDGLCGWTASPELASCLASARGI